MFAFLRRVLVPAILLAGLIVPAVSGAEALVPDVRDNADFFSADAIQKANEVIREIHRHSKHDLLIETYKTLPADRLEEFNKMDQPGKEKFFANWARDRFRDLEVNGVYVVIWKQPGHIQVEVGNETQKKAFTLDNRNELARRLLGKFREAAKAKSDDEKKKIHDQALLDAVRYVETTMRSHLGTKGSGPVRTDRPPVGMVEKQPVNVPTQQRPAATASHSWGSGLAGLLCVGLIVVVVIWVVIGLVRALTGGMRGGYGPGGGGYAPGYGGGGGGGFMTGLLGGMFGAVAGSWMYDQFFRGSSFGGGGGGWGSSSAYGSEPSAGSEPRDTDASGTGGDYDTGGDTGGGGGDYGGGGGDYSGGGGGDFGGGGGDFGGSGGDFGGGGGGDF